MIGGTGGGAGMQVRSEREQRVAAFALVLTIVFFVLVGRLGYLQVVRGEELSRWAEQNRIRIVPVVAPRGAIYDRYGRELVTNRAAFTVSLLKLDQEQTERSIRNVSTILGLSPSEIAERIERQSKKMGEYSPLRIATDVDPQTHTLIAEHRASLPGIDVEVQPVRYYPYNDLACHVLGYVGEETPTEILGRAGLEMSYQRFGEESGLAGVNGGMQVEVDARGRRIGIVGEEDPIPGHSLVLTIDAELQKVAQEVLRETMADLRAGVNPFYGTPLPEAQEQATRGAVVVMDVNNGEILAMASEPSFDPNDFAISLSVEEYEELLSSGALTNWALQNAIPPGSTFKMVTAIAALESGKVNLTEQFYCSGYYTKVPGTAPRCWYHIYGGHGSLNLIGGIAGSCDVVFYELGRRIGIDTLERYARLFGLGESTGLPDLPEREAIGTVASREVKKHYYPNDPEWHPGETLSAAIGQGMHAYSPLQMAVYVSMVANEGIRYRPHLVRKVLDSEGNIVHRFAPEVLADISDEISQSTWDAVRTGMLRVTQPGGTSYGPFADLPIQVAGKTGTVEWDSPLLDDDGWFVAFAPFDEPEIAVVVYVKGGGGGNLAGAPVARRIFDRYFGFALQDNPTGYEAGRHLLLPDDVN